MRSGGGLSAYQVRAGTNHADEATAILRDSERAARHDGESAPERLHPAEEQRRLDMADARAEVPAWGAR